MMDNSSPKMVRLKEFGVWSEQTSSSGKRYYYNRDTEVSQWEKPTEWKEHERALSAKKEASKAAKSAPKESSKSQQQPLTTSVKSQTNVTSNAAEVNHSSMPSHRNHVSSHKSTATTSAAGIKPTSASHHSQHSRSNGVKRPREEDRHDRHHHRSSGTSNSHHHVSQSTSSAANANNHSRSSLPHPSNGGHSNMGSNSVETPSNRHSSHSKYQTVSNSQPSPSSFATTKLDTTTDSISVANATTASIDRSTPVRKAHSPRSAAREQPAVPETPKISQMETQRVMSAFSAQPVPVNSSNGVTAPIEQANDVNAGNHDSISVVSMEIDPAPQEPPTPTFQEQKYLKYFRADLTQHRKNWTSENCAVEARKYADRNIKQTANLEALDNDINSLRNLVKAADVKCLLLAQKLAFVREHISSLETKNHSM
ncbi:WW domain-containing protein [Ditylenchus destructor]|uniref:WW domain-containing protein n=1 Tax=Ditylenchus destructor TaxID=166010 RepID=A0AAD4MVB0_9BILA|nr:WW domain-containing protein [Ditylenchus destructor]